jgi:hypothetical protein
VLPLQLLVEREARFQNLRTEWQAFALGQQRLRFAQERRQSFGDVPAGGVSGRVSDELAKPLGRAARQALFVDERDAGRDHLLTGSPPRDVGGELAQPAQLFFEPLGADRRAALGVRRVEQPQRGPRPMQRRGQVHEPRLRSHAGRNEVRQFGLLNRRTRAADLRLKFGETGVASDDRLQHVCRAVLEVAEHDRVGPLFLHDFGRIAEFRRAVAQHGSRSAMPRRQRLVDCRHVRGFPGRARLHHQHMHILVPERRARRRQLRRTDPQHDEHFLRTNLVRVIGQPHPVVRPFERLLQRRHAQPLHPCANRRPIRNRRPDAQPLEENPQDTLGRSQTDPTRYVHAQRNHFRTIAVPGQRRIVGQPQRLGLRPRFAFHTPRLGC